MESKIECTGITYVDGSKSLRYYVDIVGDASNVATISYPLLTSEEVEEVRRTAIENLQKILSKHF